MLMLPIQYVDKYKPINVCVHMCLCVSMCTNIIILVPTKVVDIYKPMNIYLVCMYVRMYVCKH